MRARCGALRCLALVWCLVQTASAADGYGDVQTIAPPQQVVVGSGGYPDLTQLSSAFCKYIASLPINSPHLTSTPAPVATDSALFLTAGMIRAGSEGAEASLILISMHYLVLFNSPRATVPSPWPQPGLSSAC